MLPASPKGSSIQVVVDLWRQAFVMITGAGKSSLMRILAGQDQEFEGNLQLSSGIKVGYLQQEPQLQKDSTVLENIAPALAPTRAMLTEFEEVGDTFCHWKCIPTLLAQQTTPTPTPTAHDSMPCMWY